MTKRYIYKKQDVLRLRASAWEFHYTCRVTARTMSLDRDHVLTVITACVPAPCMDGDGTLIRGMATIKGQWEAVSLLRLANTMDNVYLMCAWYWSDDGWNRFVEFYQSLPEVHGDYYLWYDAKTDAGLIVPVDNSRGTRGEPEGNPRGSRGELGQFPSGTRKKFERAVV